MGSLLVSNHFSWSTRVEASYSPSHRIRLADKHEVTHVSFVVTTS